MMWSIVFRSGVDVSAGMPKSVISVAPGFRHPDMPDEVGILLPTNHGPKQLIDAVSERPGRFVSTMPGVFMANPFLNIEREARKLFGAGIRWVTNIPSVEQQDEEFSSQLTDVSLDREREFRSLAAFQSHGLKIAAVVSGVDGAAAAVSIGADAIIVMPKVSDFAAGFPSLRQRGTAAQRVAETVRRKGWQRVILGLGESRESTSEQLWPNSVDGLICRPEFPAGNQTRD